MLVMSHSPGHWVDFFEDGVLLASIKVVELANGRAVIGYEAPATVQIVRRDAKLKELKQQIGESQ